MKKLVNFGDLCTPCVWKRTLSLNHGIVLTVATLNEKLKSQSGNIFRNVTGACIDVCSLENLETRLLSRGWNLAQLYVLGNRWSAPRRKWGRWYGRSRSGWSCTYLVKFGNDRKIECGFWHLHEKSIHEHFKKEHLFVRPLQARTWCWLSSL